jgi:hypothetical protein
MSEKKTKLMQDAEKAIANMELSKKEMESAREENAEKRETKDKAKTKKWNLQEKEMLK